MSSLTRHDAELLELGEHGLALARSRRGRREEIQRSSAPVISPKAQLRADRVTSISTFSGTLTATGSKPLLQHPPKIAVSISVPVPASLIENFGEAPNGLKSVYCSPAAP